MTVQVEYELANHLANKQHFEQYFSAAPTRMFRRNGTISAIANPYIHFFRILTHRIKKFNAQFIFDKSCLPFAKVFKVILKILKYSPVEGRGWQPLTEFLSKKKAVINI